MPPPSRRGGSRVLLAGGVATVVVLAMVVALAAALLGGGDGASFEDPEARRARLASAELTAAATALSQTSGVRYTGSFTDSGDEITVDARLTNEGWTWATMTIDGNQVTVLSNGPRTYLKAGTEYWDSHGAPRENLGDYAERWVRVPADELGIDLARAFSPGALGADLGLAVERSEARGGETTTLGGIEVRVVVTPRATVYVTAEKPERIVRITSRQDEAEPSPSGRGGGRAEIVPATGGAPDGQLRRVRGPGDPEAFEFDLTDLKPEEVTSLFTELEKRVNELRDSVDSQVTFSLDGGITLKPCDVDGCTATVSMSNRVSSRSSYLAVKQSIQVTITIRMTLDKRPVKRCSTTKSMKPNSTTTATCRATYNVPADGRTHQVAAEAKAVARATVEADIKKMFEDLKAEKERSEPVPLPGKDGDLGPNWVPCHPRTIELEHGGCEDKTDEIAKRIGGEVRTIRPPAGAKTLSTYRGYESPWETHDVVVKNGRVYDAWTGRYGEPIEVYKSRWFYSEELQFDF